MQGFEIKVPGRNSVREAVRLLEHMGFIVSNQGAGNFICCNIQRNLQDSFDLLMLLQQIDYRRLGELRAGLELQAALLALGRITDEQVRELSGMVEEMASCSSKRAAQLDKWQEVYLEERKTKKQLGQPLKVD